MAGMTWREFKCSLCGQKMNRYSGDLMIPGPEICDNCLREVWEMDDNTLSSYVDVCLEKQKRPVTLQSMLKYLQGYNQRWTNVEDVMKWRKDLFSF